LTFRFDGPVDAWLDDLVLVDNTTWIVGADESAGKGTWSVCRRGLQYVCTSPGVFTTRLPPGDLATDGWNIQESSPLRVRFHSAAPARELVIYPDGRSYSTVDDTRSF
jgi:hypothetical protein